MAFRNPVYVETKNVPDNTTYESVLQWWMTSEEANNARHAVRQNSVCIIQLGGHSDILVCVPDESAASGIRASLQSTSRQRGAIGTATLLVYN